MNTTRRAKLDTLETERQFQAAMDGTMSVVEAWKAQGYETFASTITGPCGECGTVIVVVRGGRYDTPIAVVRGFNEPLTRGVRP